MEVTVNIHLHLELYTTNENIRDTRDWYVMTVNGTVMLFPAFYFFTPTQ